MNYKYKDKEIEVNMEYESKGEGMAYTIKRIKIDAKGDLTHHIIEGIVNALKTLQPDNSHLR